MAGPTNDLTANSGRVSEVLRQRFRVTMGLLQSVGMGGGGVDTKCRGQSWVLGTDDADSSADASVECEDYGNLVAPSFMSARECLERWAVRY